MTSKRVFRTLLIMSTLIVTIGCDQVSKHIVRQKIDYHQQIGFMYNTLTLTKVENSGAFLSLGNSLSVPVKLLLLTIMPLVVLALVLLYLMTNNGLSVMTIVAICFVVGGGIGNIYDRIVYGSVTDFLHIDLGIMQTGIFNLADVSIMTGILVILGENYAHRRRLRRNA